MHAMRDALIEQLGLEQSQRRRHALEALAELDEVRLDLLFVEADLEKPALQVGEVPAIESDRELRMPLEQITQMQRDVFVIDRATWHELDVLLIDPQIVGNAIALGSLADRKSTRLNSSHLGI